jgi:hypothetical protein
MKYAAVLLILLAARALPEEPPPTAAEIMRRAAENMNRAQVERALYVYDQNVFVRMKRANGKTAREESREYVIAPGEKGAKRKLVKLVGKVIEGRKEIPYSDPKFRVKKVDIDGELTDSFAHDLLWARHGKVDWFPIHQKNLDHYSFKLEGTENYREYDVYRVTYQELKDDDGDSGCWTGEALIERNHFQPVLLTSSWDCKIPMAVKAFLGINVHHIGAKIVFRRFDNEVWFPVSCGGEMKFRVLFMYARTIAFSGSAGNFRKADVQSSIQFEGETDQ